MKVPKIISKILLGPLSPGDIILSCQFCIGMVVVYFIIKIDAPILAVAAMLVTVLNTVMCRGIQACVEMEVKEKIIKIIPTACPYCGTTIKGETR